MARTFTFSFPTKQACEADFADICTDFMADGTYRYVYLYPGGSMEKTLTIKDGMAA